jgi:LPS sulfotransferase NodH
MGASPALTSGINRHKSSWSCLDFSTLANKLGFDKEERMFCSFWRDENDASLSRIQIAADAEPLRRFCSLDADELCHWARRRTGLDDFGEPSIFPALSILVESLETEADLHPVGRFLARVHIRTLLEMRLRLVDAWKRSSPLDSQPIQRPIFITGMPRSGSTFLHELLAQDPANRAPRFWEVMFPLPAPEPGDRGAAGRIWKAEMNLWWFRRLAPLADSVYPMRAHTPHECVAIHSYTLISQEFFSIFHVPGYAAWLNTVSMLPTYAWQKCFLQLLQQRWPEKQWVLKSPDHVRGLEDLWRTFPDAVILQTHRNPLEVLTSAVQLTRVLRKIFGRVQSQSEMSAREAEALAESMEKITRFRDAHPELNGRFIDVQYRELTADPLATVRRLYDRLGIQFHETTAERIRALVSSRKPYRGRRSRPALSELGFDALAEARRFSRYCARFGIPSNYAVPATAERAVAWNQLSRSPRMNCSTQR